MWCDECIEEVAFCRCRSAPGSRRLHRPWFLLLYALGLAAR